MVASRYHAAPDSFAEGWSVHAGTLTQLFPLVHAPPSAFFALRSVAPRRIKNLERERHLRVAKQHDTSLGQALENTIRNGIPLLLEGVGEAIEPAVAPVLNKQITKAGGRLIIRLGDQVDRTRTGPWKRKEEREPGGGGGRGWATTSWLLASPFF